MDTPAFACFLYTLFFAFGETFEGLLFFAHLCVLTHSWYRGGSLEAGNDSSIQDYEFVIFILPLPGKLWELSPLQQSWNPLTPHQQCLHSNSLHPPLQFQFIIFSLSVIICHPKLRLLNWWEVRDFHIITIHLVLLNLFTKPCHIHSTILFAIGISIIRGSSIH